MCSFVYVEREVNVYLFILFVEKVHMKETKQMTLQLDRKVHDSNTCPTLNVCVNMTNRDEHESTVYNLTEQNPQTNETIVLGAF